MEQSSEPVSASVMVSAWVYHVKSCRVIVKLAMWVFVNFLKFFLHLQIGQWANWTPFTACTTTCGFTGTRFRTRTCIGAVNCIGLGREEQICNRVACPVIISNLSVYLFQLPGGAPGFQTGSKTCVGG